MSYHTFEGLVPAIYPTAFVYPNAVLIDDVVVGAGIYIGPLASLRGSYRRLIVQAGANIQGGYIMRDYYDADIIVKENGHIEHRAILHSRVIGRDALVGVNSVVTDDAVAGEENIIATMSFVKVGFRSERRQLLVGTPICVVRSVSNDRLHWKRLNTREHQNLVGRCHAALHETWPLKRMGENRPRL